MSYSISLMKHLSVPCANSSASFIVFELENSINVHTDDPGPISAVMIERKMGYYTSSGCYLPDKSLEVLDILEAFFCINSFLSTSVCCRALTVKSDRSGAGNRDFSSSTDFLQLALETRA